MKYSILTNQQFNSDLILPLPLEINSQSIEHIAFLFQFNLVNGSWSGIKSRLFFRKFWRYDNSNIFDKFSILVPQTESFLQFLNYADHLDKNSEFARIDLQKKYLSSYHEDSGEWNLTLDLIYDYRN